MFNLEFYLNAIPQTLVAAQNAEKNGCTNAFNSFLYVAQVCSNMGQSTLATAKLTFDELVRGHQADKDFIDEYMIENLADFPDSMLESVKIHLEALVELRGKTDYFLEHSA